MLEPNPKIHFGWRQHTLLVILVTLSQEQQARLTSSVMEAVKNDFTDPMVLVRLATTDNALKTAVMSAVAAFMRWECPGPMVLVTWPHNHVPWAPNPPDPWHLITSIHPPGAQGTEHQHQGGVVVYRRILMKWRLYVKLTCCLRLMRNKPGWSVQHYF